MKNSIVREKSFQFSVDIVRLHKTLSKKNLDLSRQLLRSASSVGANIHEAQFAHSSKDFIHKLSISRKEANESKYWIDLLEATSYINTEDSEKLKRQANELMRMLTSIILTMKKKTNAG